MSENKFAAYHLNSLALGLSYVCVQEEKGRHARILTPTFQCLVTSEPAVPKTLKKRPNVLLTKYTQHSRVELEKFRTNFCAILFIIIPK